MNNARKDILTALQTEFLKISTANGYTNNVAEVVLGYEKYNGTADDIPASKLICFLHARDEKLSLEDEYAFNYKSEFVIGVQFDFQNSDTSKNITMIAEDIRADLIKFLVNDSSVTSSISLNSISEYQYHELTDYIPVYDFDRSYCTAVFLLKFYITIIK